MADDEKDEPKDKDKAIDLSDVLEKLIKKHGDANSVAVKLLDENHDLRRRNAELRGQAPAEGSVVLTGDDAGRWRHYQELGKPEDLRKILREHGDLQKRDVEHTRNSELDDLADLLDWKRSVLRRVAGSERFATKEVKEYDRDLGRDNLTIRAYVIATGEDGKETEVPVREYAEAHWKDFLPALQLQQGDSPARPGTTPTRDLRKPSRRENDDRRGTDPTTEFLLRTGNYPRQ